MNIYGHAGAVLLSLFLLAAPKAHSQTPFIREGSIGEASKKAGFDPDSPGTLEMKDWVGHKFIFLPQRKTSEKSIYGAFRPVPAYEIRGEFTLPLYSIPYEKWVGKVVTVTEVDVTEYSEKVTFKSEDGTALEAPSHTDTVRDIALLRDLDYARSCLLGTTLWLLDDTLLTWDEATEKGGSFKVKRLSPLTVDDVVASSDHNAPVRLILKTSTGRTGFRDVRVSGTNASKGFTRKWFRDNFITTDPRLTHDWPKEIWDAVEDGIVLIGMTPEQAGMAWGKPTATARTATEFGVTESWEYYGGLMYLEIRNGNVTFTQQ